MIDKKNFKRLVNGYIKARKNCSVCNQHIDSGELSFANMPNIKTSWGRDKLMLFIPKEITFTIPYTHIEDCYEHEGGIEISLVPRRIISIRGI